MESSVQKRVEESHLGENMLYETKENSSQMLHTTWNFNKT